MTASTASARLSASPQITPACRTAARNVRIAFQANNEVKERFGNAYGANQFFRIYLRSRDLSGHLTKPTITDDERPPSYNNLDAPCPGTLEDARKLAEGL